MKCVLSIAGSDSSGGAGIQADIKTITAQGMYAMSAVTALTAQNTMGVRDIMDVPASFVAEQLDCIFADIKPDATKIGMLANAQIITVVAQKLHQYAAQNIVLDPVMVSTSGSNLLQDKAVAILCGQLFELATVITPNIPEAELLCGFEIRDCADMEVAAKHIAGLAASDVASGVVPRSPAILIKGGHLIEHVHQSRPVYARDLLYYQGGFHWLESPYINNPNTHGTGCTLSSAIACNLAAGLNLNVSVKAAKLYLTDALEANLDLGKGRGPLNHTPNWPEFK